MNEPGNHAADSGDRVLRAMTDDGAFRVMTIRSTQTVRDALEAQGVDGTAASQLGEILTGAILVRETMAPGNRVQILLRDTDENLIVGDSFPEGRTRGLVRTRDDVLGVRIDRGGFIQVMRSLPGRAPHQGVIETGLESGVDCALTEYFRQSEQIETMVGITAVFENEEVVHAGGYVVQLLPEVTEPPLEAMRERLRRLGSMSGRLRDLEGDPQALLDALLEGEPYTGLASSDVHFGCGCGPEKALAAVAVLGIDEVREMRAEGKPVGVNCDYCRTRYELTPDELEQIIRNADAAGSADPQS